MLVGRTKQRLALLAAPALIFLAVTLPHLGQGDWRGDTGWYAAISLQAWATGEWWTLYAEPGVAYFNKPPLPFWIHGAFLRVLGPNLVAARLPTVLAGLGCVLAVAAIARRFVTAGNAALCAVILATSYEFFRRVREISLDLWQVLFVLLAVLAIVHARGQRTAAGRFAIAGIAIGLALMCKPLMALVSIVPLAIWLLWNGRTRLAPWLLLTVGCAVFVAAPWHVSMALLHGKDFVSRYFGSEVGARASGALLGGQFEHEPWWFYLSQLAMGYWPWMLAAVPAVVSAFTSGPPTRRKSLARLGVAWSVCWLVALTLFPDRRDRYSVPIYPGLALAAGAWAWGILTPRARAAARRSLGIAGGAFAVGCVVFACLPVRVQRPPDSQWRALFAWIHESAPNGVWDGACAGAPGARVYLETGRWPTPTRRAEGKQMNEPPEGAYLLYHRRGGRLPGENELTVFESGDLKVTKLGAGGWHPTEFADPGER